MDKKEFRVLMKYYFLKAKNTVEARTWLDAEFPDTAPGQSTIKDWYANFRRGEMSTEHETFPGLFRLVEDFPPNPDELEWKVKRNKPEICSLT
ncbi:hypothetical protein GWI33_013479 [Rhynchophorus ferrugineus]|uniref:Mos1 transposase HTH domain-containing protein n=1 Tax=Rhynchophorus ferrugineus TaxID=354439 RepID=A0A834I714_RHYFE|nr:hypothetical protein GWI33_013479 [Rhynchophorus ferrugineus]